MSLLNTMFPKAVLEVVSPRPLVQDGVSGGCARSQSKPKPSLPTRIAVIGNYLPRQCGIATFTTDLCSAISAEYGTARLLALPVNDTEQGYDYPARVRWSLAQDDLKSYQEAAEFLNFNNIDMVCLQHEYGIFGGPAGSHILHLLRGLKMPVVTTLHTVLREPDPEQLRVMEEIAELSDRLIVMSQLSSQFLQEIFKVPGSKIDMVPHGVPDLPFLDPNFYKDRFGVEGKAVLLTFGLLSPNKGIENVIQALPQILSKHKNVVYIVAGATHPHILRREGDKYRASLQALAKEVGVESQVIFHDRFASPEEMAEFIGAADIYITPYRHEAQVVSGTLAYALGRGQRRSSRLRIGTQLSCWTTAAARWSLSKIPALSRKRQSNFWILRRYAMPCANAPICSRGKWSGRESRRVTWKVLPGCAATAWKLPGFSSRLACTEKR